MQSHSFSAGWPNNSFPSRQTCTSNPSRRKEKPNASRTAGSSSATRMTIFPSNICFCSRKTGTSNPQQNNCCWILRLDLPQMELRGFSQGKLGQHRHANEFGQAFGAHFGHETGAMNLDGSRTQPEIVCDRLIG